MDVEMEGADEDQTQDQLTLPHLSTNLMRAFVSSKKKDIETITKELLLGNRASWRYAMMERIAEEHGRKPVRNVNLRNATRFQLGSIAGIMFLPDRSIEIINAFMKPVADAYPRTSFDFSHYVIYPEIVVHLLQQKDGFTKLQAEMLYELFRHPSHYTGI
ncbi:unnamed protein product [Owenia fusiformis]|uniref:Uncharacterized protein n=1 Tax=Owenia fusiformis TaxID=6347 RepID=A0A8J1TVX2_OWEFU|nr:unnamed protein product [Owenia fusiformis]